MSMRWLNSKRGNFLLLFLFIFSTSFLKSQDIKIDTVYVIDTVYLDQKSPIGYEKKEKRIIDGWNRLIPRYTKLQFAGSMGLVSVGTGWNYGKNKQWETDLLFGIVPKYSTRHVKVTMTIKQNFIPWSIKLRNEKISFKPLSTGLYINTMFGSDYWRSEPSKYPSNYYKFSTKLRLNIFVGQAWEYKFNPSEKVFCKSVAFFYELSTNELYLISAATNRYIKAKDFLGLSFGVKIQFL